MKKFKFILVLIATLIIGTTPIIVGADHVQVPPEPAPPTTQHINITNPLKDVSTINELIVKILNNIVMPIAAIVSVMYIIWAGFKYVQAQGNPKAIEEANKNLLWALIGVGILLGAAGISEVVQKTISGLIDIKP